VGDIKLQPSPPLFTLFPPSLKASGLTLSLVDVLRTTLKMYQVGNVYVIAAVAVVGGALFGFDIRFVFWKYFLHKCDLRKMCC
jgi:hypothetical protein